MMRKLLGTLHENRLLLNWTILRRQMFDRYISLRSDSDSSGDHCICPLFS